LVCDFGLRGVFGFAVLGAAGFLEAGFLAGATDLTTASVAFSATGDGAGASTLYGAASGCASAFLEPKIFFNRFNIG